MESRSSRSPLLVPAGPRSNPAGANDADDAEALEAMSFELELASNPAYSEAEKENDVLEIRGRRRSTRWFSRQRQVACRQRQVAVASEQCVGTYYLIYCVFCLVLTGVLLAATLWECYAPKKEARFWRRELRVWEETAEAFVGAALCTETFAVLIQVGPRSFLRDKWRLLDSMIAGLTLVCGLFFVLRRAVHGAERVIEDVDVPILALRFALQPVRMISTASMVVRAHRKLNSEAQKTPKEIRELLPNALQHMDWNLAYSPRVHGTSLRTFYRRQAGPNILVVQDADGGIFGGFAAEAWREKSGAYGNFESFVFAVRSKTEEASSEEARDLSCTQAAAETTAPSTESRTVPSTDSPLTEDPRQGPQLEVFQAKLQKGNVIQWSDSNMLGLGHAVVVKEDFLRGTSYECESFGCTPLSLAGTDFVIRAFECWHVGVTPCTGDE